MQGLKERTGSGPACPCPDLDWALPSASISQHVRAKVGAGQPWPVPVSGVP